MGKKLVKLAPKLLICLLLMGWIIQAIFWDEGKRAWEQQGKSPSWDELTRVERLEISWQYGPPELWNSLTTVDTGYFLLSVLLVGVTLLIGMVRWRLFLRMQGFALSFSRVAEISFVAHFFNAFLLGSTGGDLIKAYYVARETHHRKTEAATTVFADRLIGLFSMLFLSVVMVLPNLNWVLSHRGTKAAVFLLFMMFAGCAALVFLAFQGGVSKFFPGARQILRKLPFGELLETSIDSCRELGRQKLMLFYAFLLSMLLNVFCVFQFTAIAKGLNLEIPVSAMFCIVPMIISIAALPITPSGLGVRENLFVIMLSSGDFNVEPTPALSLSLLALAGSLFWSLVGGIVYLTFREKHHLKDIAAAAPANNNDVG